MIPARSHSDVGDYADQTRKDEHRHPQHARRVVQARLIPEQVGETPRPHPDNRQRNDDGQQTHSKSYCAIQPRHPIVAPNVSAVQPRRAEALLVDSTPKARFRWKRLLDVCPRRRAVG